VAKKKDKKAREVRAVVLLFAQKRRLGRAYRYGGFPLKLGMKE